MLNYKSTLLYHQRLIESQANSRVSLLAPIFIYLLTIVLHIVDRVGNGNPLGKTHTKGFTSLVAIDGYQGDTVVSCTARINP
jgi:hypothetical protein